MKQNSREAFSLLGQFPCMSQSLQGGLQILLSVAHLPTVQMSSPWDAFKLWCLQGSRHAGDQFLGFLGVADFLGCQLLCVQQISLDVSVCSVSCLNALSTVDLLGWFRIWCLQGSILASRLSQQIEL